MIEERSFKSAILSEEEERFAAKFIREAALECVVDFNCRIGLT